MTSYGSKKFKLRTQNKDIVIGYSDKDGKTIIIDYDDYIKIINDALEKNYTKLPLNEPKIKEVINKNKEEMNKIIMSLCENNIIDEDMLYRTTGIIRTKLGYFSKATGSKSEVFFKHELRLYLSTLENS